ncbi:AraC family transcriptional regulator [Chryseobacterium shigense]|uniref:AraC-type DNA-binding protein n=1 Tax=Chryseobacterium shigense TaxID=297244 RepID=A0A1N7I055_9FLAO|nr:AraC family transcriptional regulator [Chryseobacterium shigense]PQA97841.1 AraC family transcriptional regulator [Chryseobacterium shigense]SIS30390.1 AraC-type DNA-binding protein [Chryseobacterium shigense]
MKQSIPTYDLSSITQHGILIERIEKRTISTVDNLFDKGIHRDSHYIFTFLESGRARMMVDFKVVEARDAALFFLLPGQVHEGILMEEVTGWFVAVKADLLPDAVRSVFEESLVDIQPVSIDKSWVEKLRACAGMLRMSYTEEMLASKEGFLVIHSLINAFTGMYAMIFLKENSVEISNESRAAQLTRTFRILVRKEFKTMKSPSAYAEALNISRGYLTDVIREVTGRSAQYWIHQEVLIEAKRLLSFTHLTIKEIAYELGYSDHAYFSRLFGKVEGFPPSEFRDKTRQ